MDPSLELIKNDLIVFFLFSKLHTTPIAIFYISLCLQVIIPILITSKQKSFTNKDVFEQIKKKHPKLNDKLHSNKDIKNGGYGLLNKDNIYLLFLPFLNYAIFDYYQNAGRNIYHFLYIQTQDRTVAEKLFLDAFSSFNTPLASIIPYVGLTIGVVVSILFLRNYKEMSIEGHSKNEGRHDWLFKNGKPRTIAYFFTFTTHFLQVAIIFGCIVRHILLSLRVIPYVMSKMDFDPNRLMYFPDKMFGFYPWEDLTSAVALIATFLGFVIFSWIVGTSMKHSDWHEPYTKIGPLMAMIGYIVLIPLALLSILQPCHKKQLELQTESLSQLSHIIIQKPVFSNESQNSAVDAIANIELIASEERLFSIAKENRTWPLQLPKVLSLGIQLLLPALFSVILNKVFAKKE
jgi:hypothetical protein